MHANTPDAHSMKPVELAQRVWKGADSRCVSYENPHKHEVGQKDWQDA